MKHNIIHKDIKPANVLINGEGQYMISDFGISTRLRNTMRRNMAGQGATSSGTIAYMSYETLKNNPVDSFARDIWAFGASLYEMMTGDVPFGEYGGITQKAQNGKIPKIEEKAYSQRLKDLVYKCLAMETWKRPSAEEILQMTSVSQPISIPIWKSWKRNAIVAAILIAIVGGTVTLTKPNREPLKPPYSQTNIAKKDTLKSSINREVITRIKKANNIVASEGRKKDADKRSERKLIAAAKMYREAISLNASDSIIDKGKAIWATSQNVIDNTYTSLYNKATEYRNAGAENAEKTMFSKCQMLSTYVSPSIRK